jgi:uncharacterized membrane protein
MTHLERVTNLGGGRSHWVAKGPAGSSVEWDAEIINEVENRVIGWRSIEGSDVVMAGAVNFSPARDGTACEVSVHLKYEPPLGRAGAAFATLAGANPSRSIREDLRHMKQLLESGE